MKNITMPEYGDIVAPINVFYQSFIINLPIWIGQKAAQKMQEI
jgi:hypothetical protein